MRRAQLRQPDPYCVPLAGRLKVLRRQAYWLSGVARRRLMGRSQRVHEGD